MRTSPKATAKKAAKKSPAQKTAKKASPKKTAKKATKKATSGQTTSTNVAASASAAPGAKVPDKGQSPESIKEDAHSLLFLSCDLVGSTKFKQDNPHDWREVFLEFYRGFPRLLADVCDASAYAGEFKLWKPIGDELIFTTLVTREHDVCEAVRIWLTTLQRYEEETLAKLAEDSRNSGVTIKGKMATKGAAFIATFPDPDSHSSIPRDPDVETTELGSVITKNRVALDSGDHTTWVFDYFGTSIDTGFRVSSKCDRRFFTLSIEVVHAMSSCCVDQRHKTDCKLDDLRLLETLEFKGVWDGREYPLFALDRQHEDEIHQALATIQKVSVDPEQVRHLCETLTSDPTWPAHMYLPKSDWPMFTVKPSDPWIEAIEEAPDDEGLEEPPSVEGGSEKLERTPPLDD